ncbi:MAG: phosphotransferase family protein [Myxococcota bacterium]|nr:phosphotransferase family protein [Myxococcota bacterium]
MSDRFLDTSRVAKRGETLSLEEMTARLSDFVASRESVEPGAVEVTGLRRLPGGSSRLLWSVQVAIDGSGDRRTMDLVLRQDPPGRIQKGGMELEFHILKAAAGEGVPVPPVHWCEPEGDCLGAPFFAMDRMQGETIPRRLLRDEKYEKTRSRLCPQLAETLAAIHRVDFERADLSGLQRPEDPRTVAREEVERLVAGYRAFSLEPHPVLDLAERWLLAHIPAPEPLALVHGDFRIGNIMFDESGLVSVLDWELAHVGDPVEDLAWLCVRAWRFGQDTLPVGGIGTRDALLAEYEAAGGRPVDPAALRFWEMLGNFKLALVFITQARAYLDGAHATVELASLGRRIAEPEAELLALMKDA